MGSEMCIRDRPGELGYLWPRDFVSFHLQSGLREFPEFVTTVQWYEGNETEAAKLPDPLDQNDRSWDIHLCIAYDRVVGNGTVQGKGDLRADSVAPRNYDYLFEERCKGQGRSRMHHHAGLESSAGSLYEAVAGVPLSAHERRNPFYTPTGPASETSLIRYESSAQGTRYTRDDDAPIEASASSRGYRPAARLRPCRGDQVRLVPYWATTASSSSRRELTYSERRHRRDQDEERDSWNRRR